MVNSLLRKRRGRPSNQDGSIEVPPTRAIRPSLSLPDLTTPLLDPESWEELPSFNATSPTTNVGPSAVTKDFNGRNTTPRARGRKASLVGSISQRPGSGGVPGGGAGGGGAVQFHKPFSPWQLVLGSAGTSALHDQNTNIPSTGEYVQGYEDFRHSKAQWGRESMAGSHHDSVISRPVSGARRRRGKGKVAGKLNILVVGGKSVGKTSFINLLLDSFNDNHEPNDNLDHEQEAKSIKSLKSTKSIPPPRSRFLKSPSAENIPLPESTPSSPTVPGPPAGLPTMSDPAQSTLPRDPSSSILLPPIESVKSHDETGGLGISETPGVMTTKGIQSGVVGPTRRISSKTSLVHVEGYERHHLRIIDTPGLELGTDDTVKEKERERGIMGLMRLLEDQFGQVMKEESRIIRRGPKGDDDLIHLVIYLIDGRRVLSPPTAESVQVDWSAVGVFDDSIPEEVNDTVSSSGPTVDQVDLEIIRQLKSRANVLPILGRIDALSTTELDIVRSTVRRQLAEAFPEDLGFGIFDPTSEGDDYPTPTGGSRSTARNGQLASPDTIDVHSASDAKLPYAIFSPETPAVNTWPSGKGQRSEQLERFTRGYAWGTANVMDPKQSDFLALREAVFGLQAKTLKMTTREVLYESYRTERLLSRQSRG